MCGRYYFDIDEDEIKSIAEQAEKNIYGDYNTKDIYPSNIAPIYVEDDHKIKPILAKWGLPKWDKKGLIINARVETLEEKQTFKTLLKQRRCIVPASAYFEWKQTESSGKKKDKYIIKKRSSILYFAGLYNIVSNNKIKQLSLFDSNSFDIYYTIITKKADSSVDYIHDRMPVIFEKEQLNDYLNGKSINDMLKDNTHLLSEKVNV